uniref:hypothetical protein n=1 Tax=Hylemonella sp. TaxID=2066020 RepID=UPI0035B216E0
MPRTRRAALAALVLLAGLAVLLLGLQHWVASDAMRERIEREAAAALGVPVRIERLGLTLWPLPGVVLDGVQLRTRQPLKAGRIELRPAWASLLLGRPALATLVVRRAELPQKGIDALLASLQSASRRDAASDAGAWALLPRRTVLDQLRWIDDQGQALVIQAEARLDSDALPGQLTLELVEGRLQGARVDMRRDGERFWDFAVQVAGGSVRGRLELQPPARPGAEFVLLGELTTREVEVSRLTAPAPTEAARAAQPLSGRLEATTTLSVRARQPSELAEALQTQSRFTVRGAVLQGVDLVKAVKTAGVSRGGRTTLDTLSGQVTTRGSAIELQNLAASSGVLGATGQVSVSPAGRLGGRITVELAGAVGVPLAVGGTLEAPEVNLTTGARIGAALGTVLMPGVGTGAGASVGGKLGELFSKPPAR